MKIFLAGGGSEKDSLGIDKAFSDSIGSKKKVMYVPIAMETDDYSDCLKWIKSTFSVFRISDIEMVTNLSLVRNVDNAVYIGGGNTFKLLKEIRKTGFDKKLTEHAKNNGVIYGGSAGAIIMGQSILTSPDKNDVDLTRFGGLNIIKGFSVWCHYENKHRKRVLDFVMKNRAPVIALTEKSGVMFDGKSITSLGSIPASVFRDDKEIIIKNGPLLIK